MKLRQLIEDMSRIESHLINYEKKFGVRSKEFYQTITSGEPEEFDAPDDYRMEFIEWLSFCKTLINMKESYRQLIMRQPVTVQIKTALAA